MSKKKGLESIVPPPELCAKIPDGTFAESSLIWFIWKRNGELSGYVVPREMKDQFANALPMLLAVLHKELPAPTLAEIMDNLLLETNDCEPTLLWQGGWHIQCAGEEGYDMTSAATAALRLWLEVNSVAYDPSEASDKTPDTGHNSEEVKK